MISPHTPPGTKVVAVHSGIEGLLVVGAVYTVRGWVNDYPEPDPFAVLLDEFEPDYHFDDTERGWNRRYFRYLDLPSCLTSALTSQPLVHDREPEVVE